LNAEAEMRAYQSRGRYHRLISSDNLANLIAVMHPRRACLTEIRFLDTVDSVHNPAAAFLGIDTGTYVNHMVDLINFLKYGMKGKD
jgi:hypothetical protein